MNRYYKGPKSDHFDGNRFFNPIRRPKHFFFNFLRWQITSHPHLWPKHIDHVIDEPPLQVEGSTLRVTFVGHSTVLVQTQGYNILTDPIWSERASPFSRIGPKRVCDPGIPFDKLPKIDLILISHNHYDHLDRQTILKIWKRDHPTILTPLGNDVIIHSFDPNISVETLDWHQCKKLNDQVTVHLEPTQHWSARAIGDRDQALWGAFVIETAGGNIYFAGDTGYDNGDHFRKACQKFGSFRLALLPIGTFEPRWFMKYGHMNPEEAVYAFKDLNALYGMAIHFCTFRLSDEGYEKPLQLLSAACKRHHIPENQFRSLQIGQTWQVPLD